MVLSDVTKKLFGSWFKEHKNFSSGNYWESRYASGRNSGAGSYGRLAAYKADIINGLIRDHDIRSIIEYGSGDGNQATLLNPESYVGVDVSSTAVKNSRLLLKSRENFTFHHAEDRSEYLRNYDMSMSLDVIYHLVEDSVFESYMTDLFDCASRFCLIYASDRDANTSNQHVRHRQYSKWVADQRKDWACVKVYDHPFPKTEKSLDADTSFAHFKLFEKQTL